MRTAQAQPWCCANCGFWQRWPSRPAFCPACLDPRHALPLRAWEFRVAGEVANGWRTLWRQVTPGLWRFTTAPQLGLGGVGYVVKRPEGNIAFEACAWYSEVALAWIAALGGVAWAAASHPHSYGGLWQLQERFGCEVSVQRDDLGWTGAFRCTWPFDDTLDLGGGLSLHATGGHFEGHAVLHDVGHGVLFCGDAVRLERAPSDPREVVALSVHKGLARAIPLTAGELRRYRAVVEPLTFSQTWSPFEQSHDVGRDDLLALLDHRLEGRPSTAAVALAELRGEEAGA